MNTEYYELIYLEGGPEPFEGRAEIALLTPADTTDVYGPDGLLHYKRTARKWQTAECRLHGSHTVFEFTGLTTRENMV